MSCTRFVVKIMLLLMLNIMIMTMINVCVIIAAGRRMSWCVTRMRGSHIPPPGLEPGSLG